MLTVIQPREEHDNDFGGRPGRIRDRREAIREYTDLRVPRSLADVPEWYSRYKGVLTKRLDDESGGEE